MRRAFPFAAQGRMGRSTARGSSGGASSWRRRSTCSACAASSRSSVGRAAARRASRARVLPAVEEGAIDGPAKWRSIDVAELATKDKDPEAAFDELTERAAEEDEGTIVVADPLEDAVEDANAVALLALIAEREATGVRAVVMARSDGLEKVLALRGLGDAVARGALLVSPLRAST